MSERAKGSQIEVEGLTLPEKLSDLQADINSKANADAVAQALATKADADAVAQALETKADNSAVSLALADKADKSELNGLATEAFVSQAVSGLATEASVADKADKTYVDTELGKKADADAVAQSLETKADATALADKADASALAQLRSDAVLESELASGTGNSPTKVMSQKAVTDAMRTAVGAIEEAPVDGKQYARKDASWTEVEAGAVVGAIEEAPVDGKQYARKDASWTEVEAGAVVVQSTGQSSEEVMSQKAVTDALEGKVDKEVGKGLSTNDFTTPLKNKLEGLEGSHWRGTYPSYASLATDVVSPLSGDYADVDGGVGEDVIRYLWDASDSKWVAQESAASITAAQVKQLYESNADTNAFSDEDKTKLNGIAAGANAYLLPNSGPTTSGGVKTRLSGTVLYMTNNGTNPSD